ncbi:MAG: hypothetical protein LBD75_04400 [Candidatus Peribacteria bacterium]|jgi:hypothetical protein|nr:hypothetical protein [Candidatus Peribacteria bacterium]
MNKFLQGVCELLGVSEQDVKKSQENAKRKLFHLVTVDVSKESIESIERRLSKANQKIQSDFKKGTSWIKEIRFSVVESLVSFVKKMENNVEKLSLCSKMRKVAEKAGWTVEQAEELAFIYYELPISPLPDVSDEALSEFLTKLLKVYEENVESGKSAEEAFELSKEGMKLL